MMVAVQTKGLHAVFDAPSPRLSPLAGERNMSFFLLSPARGRGWERGLQAFFDAPSPHLSP